jgi:ankyrin repeat protein
MADDGPKKNRRIPYTLLLYFFFAIPALCLLHTTGNNDYYTVLGFHAQKRGLSSLFLYVALLIILGQSISSAQSKATKIICMVLVIGWIPLVALPLSTMIKFNQRVNNGTLVEVHGNTTLLMTAAYEGNILEIEKLIKNGADVNAHNDVNNTALHFATGATPIQNQIYRGSPEAVNLLIKHGADVNSRNKTGITPLMDAVYNNNLESLKILLAHGADPNAQSKYMATALSEAIIRRYRDIAMELLHSGANPNVKDFTGRTPLQTAQTFHEISLVEALRKYGAKE